MEQTPKLWKTLNEYANYLEARFDEVFERYEEPKINKLNFKNWNNTFWSSNVIRKCHLKTIVPKDGRDHWLMHVNVFPNTNIELPILGFNIAASPKKITSSFMDYSPLYGFPHPYHDYMEMRVAGLEWNMPQNLPPWASEIFSGDVLTADNIDTDAELNHFIQVMTDLVDYYLDNLNANALETQRDIKPLLNRYCQNQKLNPHLHRSILAMGISEQDKNDYVNNVLFEEI